MRIPTPLGIILAASLVFLTGCSSKVLREDAPYIAGEDDEILLVPEMRAVWLATVNGIDWPSPDDGPEAQKEKLSSMIRSIRATGCNTVFFQVVSNMDALYPSALLPWSHVLTGRQGVDPGYDPLALAVELCRENGLQIHAWINPLRAGPDTMERTSGHVVKAHPGWVRKYRSSYYLDPALAEVRDFLGDIATELLKKYDLDGIHIDDYFYPAGFRDKNLTWDDSAQYKREGKGLTLDEWRFSNINRTVEALYEATHEADPEALFGVSPGGRMVNTLALYADPSVWVKEGTVDYIIPQIYWQHGHRIADFPTVLESWREVAGDVPVLGGLAAYRYGQTGFERLSEFSDQVEKCRGASFVVGHSWFSAKCILDKDFSSFLREGPYRRDALPPTLGRTGMLLATPTVRVTGRTISWIPVFGVDSYAVFELEKIGEGRWYASLVQNSRERSFRGEARKNYVVMSVKGKYHSRMSDPIFISTF